MSKKGKKGRWPFKCAECGAEPEYADNGSGLCLPCFADPNENDVVMRHLRELLLWVSKRSNDAHQRKQSARTFGNTVRKELRRRLALFED